MKEQIEKQAIEEMAKIAFPFLDIVKPEFYDTAIHGNIHVIKPIENLYNAGYRKQRVGEWLYDLWDAEKREYVVIPFIEGKHGFAYCSICNGPALLDRCVDPVASDFCPNCGARMKGGAE